MDKKFSICFSNTILNPQDAKKAVKMIFQEPLFVNGPVNEKTLTVSEVEVATTNVLNDTLWLTTNLAFNNATGDIVVEYDATKVALYGTTGFIPSFSMAFTPIGLVQAIPPNPEEYFNVDVTQLLTIYQVQTYPYYSPDVDSFVITATQQVTITALETIVYDRPTTDMFTVGVTQNLVITDLGVVVP